MSETRKIAAILVADVVGYSRLAGADEDRTLSRLRGLRSDLIDPAIAAHRGRVVKRTGDGAQIFGLLVVHVWIAGAAKLHLRADEEAVTWLGRSIESDRNWPLTHFFLAAALANLGRLEEARAATQAGLALDPTFTIHRFHVAGSTSPPGLRASRNRGPSVFPSRPTGRSRAGSISPSTISAR